MWNQPKPPSVRDLAARIEARNVDVATIRDEQRALQRALEAEQAARIAAISAAVDRIVALSDRLTDTQEALEHALARLTALEGEEIPAAGGPVQDPGPGAASVLGGGDTVIDPPAEGSAHPEVDLGAPADLIPPGNALADAGAELLADKPAPDAPELEPYRYSWNG